ncbi:RNA polymerase sigma factor [Yeosuana sp. MJ-SS3]|jgi:RNA polymerase sigma-70 factor (ECF subfamily)|uniref:RNA polymerase sigma factor n=1 Tax=Gilvirhabdus luticola TaxID=3079858 RepID=A0ABU3U621_9FLAO|nr:RNA polymerase sigma factor [Yeosuana sp. MJ-SS3]MDU8885764.1 RNA polymerase sigma factor [Yeosuana sp. MJ-SS3]
MKSLLKVIQLYKNENTLIKKASQNNREAQKAIFDLYAPKMLSVCRYYIKDLQHAEDVMLKGFFKVFSNLKAFTGKGNFEGWIRRIMVNESISYLRQQKKVELSFEEVEINQEDYYFEHSFYNVDEIQQCIDSLPKGYKMVFIMYAVEGYKHHEIAEILNISEGTSKSQLFKARKLLQQMINELNKTSYGSR